MRDLEFDSMDEALAAIEDLLGILQDLRHRIDSIDDFDAYGVVDSLLKYLDSTLERYDALED